jgi:hypothetical protein
VRSALSLVLNDLHDVCNGVGNGMGTGMGISVSMPMRMAMISNHGRLRGRSVCDLSYLLTRLLARSSSGHRATAVRARCPGPERQSLLDATPRIGMVRRSTGSARRQHGPHV